MSVSQSPRKPKPRVNLTKGERAKIQLRYNTKVEEYELKTLEELELFSKENSLLTSKKGRISHTDRQALDYVIFKRQKENELEKMKQESEIVNIKEDAY